MHFAHATLHIEPAKYDSTSGTKISMFEKKLGEWDCRLQQASLNKRLRKMRNNMSHSRSVCREKQATKELNIDY